MPLHYGSSSRSVLRISLEGSNKASKWAALLQSGTEVLSLVHRIVFIRASIQRTGRDGKWSQLFLHSSQHFCGGVLTSSGETLVRFWIWFYAILQFIDVCIWNGIHHGPVKTHRSSQDLLELWWTNMKLLGQIKRPCWEQWMQSSLVQNNLCLLCSFILIYPGLVQSSLNCRGRWNCSNCIWECTGLVRFLLGVGGRGIKKVPRTCLLWDVSTHTAFYRLR